MMEDKLAAIRDWPTLTSVEDVRSFLGLCGFYRRFVKNFSTISAPLSELLHKDIKYHWDEPQNTAFLRLKESMLTRPVLILPDPLLSYTVTTDASGYGVGATLSQDQGNGLQPIAFLSKKLNPAEKKYPVHEQELLAIILALKEWRHYLHGTKFTVVTDHHSLRWLKTQPSLSQRQTRWIEAIAEFDFHIEYQEGKKNVVADALSRRPDHNPTRSTESPQNQLTTVTTSSPLIESLLTQIIAAYTTDPKYTAILEQPTRYTEYHVKDNLLYYQKHRIYVPNDTPLKTLILHECHDTPTSGHLGTAKTLEQVKRYFYWTGMDAEIKEYVTTCLHCQSNKPSSTLPMGLLQPLPIPTKPWEQVSMDLITQLPRTKSGNDAIVVIVDKFTKMVHYAATTTTVNADRLAHIFWKEIVRHHGIPKSIVSDRDPRFTSLFWKSLWELLQTKLAMSTAFHPETDGQTERANRTLEDMLRAYVNNEQDNWDEHLVSLEIAYNNSLQASTGFTPFHMNYLQHPNLPLSEALRHSYQCNNPSAADRIQLYHRQIQQATENLKQAQQRQKKYADEHRRDMKLQVGDQVLLSTANLRFLRIDKAPKLLPKFIGPYAVTKVISPTSYELDLPQQLRIHPVFHLDKLKLFKEVFSFSHQSPTTPTTT